MKNKLFTIFTGLMFTVNFPQLSAQEKYFEKRVDFPEGATLQQKIDMAARVVPTPQQLNWQQLEMTAFLHFGINTFTGREWGDGSESPQLFNPVNLDALQWVKVLKDAGMKMVIITAKHHDGFCLWPTKTTSHSVASSPWKNGNGDVVKELREACDEFGMKFGVYLSPWDRNAECYGDSPAYNRFFLEQLTELLTWYGKVDEVWFDGANGEGPNGKKQEYDWEAYYDKIKELQSNAVTAVMGEDVRWVGTETGYGRETEWSVTALAPGGREEMATIKTDLKINAQSKDLGSRQFIDKARSLFWYPAEVDVSIRPGWFYHSEEDNRVKSLAKMTDIYFNSVGLNAVLLLNIPPDKRGLIHENDAARLRELKEYLDQMYSTNQMEKAVFSQEMLSETIPGDNILKAFWQPSSLPAMAEARFNSPATFNVIMLQEDITRGQRVEAFRIDVLDNGQWKTVARSTTIGYKKMLRVPQTQATAVRLVIEEARGKVTISNMGLYIAPEILTEPEIRRNKEGMVSIITETAHPVIKYTVDGSAPTPDSQIYTEPFPFPEGGVIKAKSFINNMEEESAAVTKVFFMAPVKWKVISKSDELLAFPAENAIDGNSASMWHTPWQGQVNAHPHHITVDMGETLRIKGFSYTPRDGENKSGTISHYKFSVSRDGKKWTTVIENGEFSNITNNPVEQLVSFNKTYKAQYFRLESLRGAYDEPWISAGEIGIQNVYE